MTLFGHGSAFSGNKINTIIKQNFVNYGVNFVGMLVIYIFGAICLQTLFGLSAITANAISNSVVACFCLGGYIKDKYMDKVPTVSMEGHITVKGIILSTLYVLIMIKMILLFFHWSLSHIPDVGMASRTNTFNNMTVWTYVWFSCILSPITEEIIMRGFIYNKLKQTSHWIVAMFVSSIGFAFLHGTVAHMIMGTAFACMMVFIYESTGSLWLPIIYHMIYNVISLFYTPSENIYNNDMFMFILFIFFIAILVRPIVKLNQLMKPINGGELHE